mmetsp:Transcript_37013/g.57887  ORF Transcript_37013/g.57887 Transcript_37013/m.57887 type:complete len:130 (-) Transcript_37013:126-515(-)
MEDPKAGERWGWKWIFGSASVGAAAAPSATVAAIHSLGFGSVGILTKSTAAGMMSAEALGSGGMVAAGSMVAKLQSIGAAGLGLGGTITTACSGALLVGSTVCGCHWAYDWVQRKRMPKQTQEISQGQP